MMGKEEITNTVSYVFENGNHKNTTSKGIFLRGGDGHMEKSRTVSDALVKINHRLRQAGIRWAIFAGAAAFCYGSEREITDVDILVRCEDLEKAKTFLREVNTKGFDIVAGAEIKTNEGTCLFFLDDRMIEKLNSKKLFGVKVPVLSVEDNIVFKAILQRGKERGKHDVEDIKAMIAHEKIDLEYLSERIRKCHAGTRVNSLLRSVIPELT
jgi:predicted nucleotidyltransferase